MDMQSESLLRSAFRSFLKVFFAVFGFLCAFIVLGLVYGMFASPYSPEEKTTMTLSPDLNDELELRPFNAPVILRISIHGIIGDPLKLDSDTIERILIDSNRGILKHRVKAILLHFKTPGGTADDSDNIYRMLTAYKEKYKIPIYGFVDGLCASGGMYISCAADKMYASHTSVIGSVGVVIGPFFNVVDALNKWGVTAETVTQGLDKDAMNPFRPWKENEDASFRSLSASLYHQFVDIVVASHPRMDKDLLINEYGANVFDGPGAMERGYIDVADTDYKTALYELMIAANIDPQHPYQIVELTPKFNLFNQLSSNASALFTGKIEHHVTLRDKETSFIRDQFAYLYEPGTSRWKPSTSLMP